MYSVMIEVDLREAEPEQATRNLREDVIPAVSAAPGFVSGHWTRSGDGSRGLAFLVFESQADAEAAAGRNPIGSHPSPDVTIERCEVREVLAHAEASAAYAQQP